jgi:hypothetical protein
MFAYSCIYTAPLPSSQRDWFNRSVRWDDLFADLEAQAGALELTERAAEVAEHTRIEVGRLRLVDRLRGADNLAVRVGCLGGVSVRGTVEAVGAGWLLLDEGSGREALIRLEAVTTVAGLGRQSGVPREQGAVESRLGLRHALRAVARDRSSVRAGLIDGGTVDGTLDRVGADFVELAVHPPGEARRRSGVRKVLVVPLTALAVLSRD